MNFAAQDEKTILQVHDTTLPHLDFIEKILLDQLVKLGRAEIISEKPEVAR